MNFKIQKQFLELENEADNIERSKHLEYNQLLKRQQEFVDNSLLEKWKVRVEHLLNSAFGIDNAFSRKFIEKKINYMGNYSLFKQLRPIFSAAKDEFESKCTTKTDTSKPLDSSKIFIVHGRDDLAKTEVARFIEKLGFSAIILHEQASSGKTIIEKIEELTNDVGFAIVLYTPCDIGGLAGEEKRQSRARQNVVFEHGYLIGKLGRKNVCALVKGEIETPNDISGVVYVPLDDNRAWHNFVAKELRNAGYPVDMNMIL
jgi:predicted nucleotide-binding protein